MQILGIAMITNCCILDYETKEVANHAEVVEVANKRAKDMQTLVAELMPKIESSE